jgi:hypothetical protein
MHDTAVTTAGRHHLASDSDALGTNIYDQKSLDTHTSLSTRNVMFKKCGFSSARQRENCWIFQSEKLDAVYLATLPARLSDSTDSRWLLASTLCIKYLLAGLALFSPTPWLPSRLEKSPPALPPFLSSRYRRELGGAILFTRVFSLVFFFLWTVNIISLHII